MDPSGNPNRVGQIVIFVIVLVVIIILTALLIWYICLSAKSPNPPLSNSRSYPQQRNYQSLIQNNYPRNSQNLQQNDIQNSSTIMSSNPDQQEIATAGLYTEGQDQQGIATAGLYNGEQPMMKTVETNATPSITILANKSVTTDAVLTLVKSNGITWERYITADYTWNSGGSTLISVTIATMNYSLSTTGISSGTLTVNGKIITFGLDGVLESPTLVNNGDVISIKCYVIAYNGSIEGKSNTGDIVPININYIPGTIFDANGNLNTVTSDWIPVLYSHDRSLAQLRSTYHWPEGESYICAVETIPPEGGYIAGITNGEIETGSYQGGFANHVGELFIPNGASKIIPINGKEDSQALVKPLVAIKNSDDIFVYIRINNFVPGSFLKPYKVTTQCRVKFYYSRAF